MAEMAGGETAALEDELLLQIQSLVSDSLRVVSYKWLSRDFLLSSNAARRLLQKFAKQNEDSDLEIVYAISGWSSKEPSSYAIQLVPKSKLEEAKAALKESPSIHVYSVQRCLPKDPAQLWSADFVQAEQLFNESADSNNCLRDNRFSAVTCKLVQRFPTRRNSRVTSAPQPQPLVPNHVARTPTSSTISVPKPPVLKTPAPSILPKNSETTLKDASGGKKPSPQSASLKPHGESKDSSGPGTTGKRRSLATSGGSGGGASLASMWGKAPSKSKTVTLVAAAATTSANPPPPSVTAGDAEARIQAMEAEASSEDDMATEFTSLRRGQVNNGGGRRRRMIVDDDEDGEDVAEGDDDSETVIRLGTPESPEKLKPSVAAVRDNLDTNGGASSVHEKLPNPNKEIRKVQGKPSKLEPNLQPNLDSKTKTTGEKAAEVKAHPRVPVSESARGGSKRKKVLKTRIDERGREVTEVVFETEGEEKENVEKDVTPAAKRLSPSSKQIDIKPKPEVVPKPSTVPSKTAASKAITKTSAKSAIKPGKGQGNIMSFFKKT